MSLLVTVPRFVMTSLVHLLTAATIFVHATMGCCAHEAHDAIQGTSGEPSTSCCCEHDTHGQGTHGQGTHGQGAHEQGAHEHDGGGLSQELPQPAPHECSHTDCTWPAPEVRNSGDFFSLDFAGIVPWPLSGSRVSSSELFVLGNGLGNGFNFPGLLPNAFLRILPVRSHLAKCVLLI